MKKPARSVRPTQAQREAAALRRTVKDLHKRGEELRRALAAERIANAVPRLTITAEPEHLLIVKCDGLGMRVRTRAVTVSSARQEEG
jgi:hypothetical protein